MLTRLQIAGFKNLIDVDVRFGPFTCIAGANGVGKSNLLDAISFLSALAEKPLIDAALLVRDESGRTGDVRSLFHRVGNTYSPEMSFDADMIIPQKGFDDLGQPAVATITLLRYGLTLRYKESDTKGSSGGLQIVREELTHIKRAEAKRTLLFPYSAQWAKSALKGRRTTPFISTEAERNLIKIHQDGGNSGRARTLSAENLPRTAISATNAAETPTATLAKREMQSWRILQLEPSSLRTPDSFSAPTRLGSDGSHLAATVFRMGKNVEHAKPDTNEVFVSIGNRLSELIDDVKGVSIDRDDRRELLTLYITGKDGTKHPARALSDGTLRFLALAVLELDPETTGLLCMEEPENGIHPRRIPAILNLLRDIAVDMSIPVSGDNPLRQVIINTHSPSVVAEVRDGSLLMAELRTFTQQESKFSALSFSCLSGTWRASDPKARIVSRGKILDYLNPFSAKREGFASDAFTYEFTDASHPLTRVIDRQDLQLTLTYE